MPLQPTVQKVFNAMALLDNQLDLVSGGDDVSRALAALNLMNEWCQAVAAQTEGLLTTHNLVYTAANTETTPWPEDLLRLDSLWYIDSATGRPVWQIKKVQGIGNHVPGFAWPLSELLFTGSTYTITGKPKEYVGSGPGGLFYWVPLPDAEYWVRAYGLWAVADYAAAADNFAFPRTLLPAFAAGAVKVLRLGLDRDLSAIENEAKQTLETALRGLKKFDHTGPVSRVYEDVHDA